MGRDRGRDPTTGDLPQHSLGPKASTGSSEQCQYMSQYMKTGLPMAAPFSGGH